MDIDVHRHATDKVLSLDSVLVSTVTLQKQLAVNSKKSKAGINHNFRLGRNRP